MKVLISGKHMKIGEALRTHIETHLEKNVKKYFENAIQAHVFISKEKQHLFKVDITVNDGTGKKALIVASAETQDPYLAFDYALVKIGKQLRRYKSRIKDHQKDKGKRNIFLKAKKYVLSSSDEEKESKASNESPIIIAEKATTIEKLSVSDAVMKMDLLNLPALAFINSKSGRINVVYYRKDSNISWLDIPELKK